MSEEVRICSSCWEEDCVCDYEQYITLDAGIADTVIELNLKGYLTTYSCEGHILEDDGNAQSKIIDIYLKCPNHRFESLPEGFTYPKAIKHRDFHRTILYKYVKGKLLARINGKYIPYDLEADRQKHLMILREWAEALPAMDRKNSGCYSEYLQTGRPKQSFLEYELPKCSTFTVLIKPEDYNNISLHITGYGGKVLEVEEVDEKLKINYWAKTELF